MAGKNNHFIQVFSDAFSAASTAVYEGSPAHFFGVPFLNFERGSKKAAFLWGFLGWNQIKFPLWLNVLRACFFGLVNPLLIVPRFLLNIVKLVTEFIPLFLANLTKCWIENLMNKFKSSTNYCMQFFAAVGLIILSVPFLVSSAWHVLGRAITSPHKSLYAAWHLGINFASDGWLGKALGAFFCVISLAITTAAYVLLFPLAIKLIASYAPTAIASTVQAIFQLPWLMPLAKLGNALSIIMNPIFQGIAIYSAPVMTGIAAVIGMTAGPLVALLDGLEAGIVRFAKNRCPVIQPKNLKIEENSIGQGTYAKIHKALYNDQCVAVKIINDGVPDGINRSAFTDEVTFLTRCDSPYIITLHGACFEEGMIVMEYAPESSLNHFLEKSAADAWEIRYRIAIDIGMGIQYLHGQGIIHADLKSFNVLISAEQRAKITDFNSAKFESDDSLNNGVEGSQLWMAPEIFDMSFNSKAKPTKASDVYSYGVILWELGARKLPLDNTPRQELYMAAQNRVQYTPMANDTPPQMQKLIPQFWSSIPKDRPLLENGKVLETLTEEFAEEYQQAYPSL